MSEGILVKVKELLEPILLERNLTLEDLEYVNEGKNYFLRVYIDKDGGVDLTECSIVSEQLSEKLDEHDPIKEAYYLEVSSPGAEKPLKTAQDFAMHVGKNVYVSLYVHIDGEKEYEGILTDFSNNIATVNYKFKHRMKQVQIPYDKIAKARLAVVL
ncbi:ribosome maturation factor RimP [Pseudogracilibacillus sp. SE30717A]|uniref:ribosome maturation factor RimP n=1 Tax=Pseudogracilibacillus sp. SE30717A TaxID=3098293 RepID=UPI003FA6FF6D